MNIPTSVFVCNFSLYAFSAVNEDVLTGYVTTLFGAEKCYCRRTVLRFSVKAYRYACRDFSGILSIGQCLNIAVGVDNTGRNIVYGNTVRC